MNKIRFVVIMVLLMVGLPISAQLVTTTPEMLQQSSTGVVLTYHAASPLGNKGLANLSSSTAVYAHIGVITNSSTSSSDWKHVVSSWPTSASDTKANTAKNRLTMTAANTYTLSIGNLRDYFGITSSSEKIKAIAIVFRTADGNKTGRNADGSDILVPVLEDGFQMLFEYSNYKNIISENTTMTFNITTTNPASIDLSVNNSSIASTTNSNTLSKSHTFSAPGNYTVTATASYGGTTRTESVNIVYLDSSNSEDYPGGIPKMGTVKNADGSVTFCFAAPGKNTVTIVPSWDDYQVLEKNRMKYQDYQGNRYFWITINGLPNDEWLPYYYYVDETYKVGDPYAKLVLDPYNDNASMLNNAWRDRPRYPREQLSGVFLGVYRGDIDEYDWTPFTIPNHENLVIYELLFRDFTGIEGAAAGSGTVRKAMERIPYLKELGVNVIELMPIMEFNGNQSWGYNTNFYMAPDKAYGSPTDYKDFIDLCHQNGMAVVLDIVLNQSDGCHPWYQMYPIESNPFYNKEAPHSWSVLNDWKQDNPLVQQQWTDALIYWMTAYNVDGFRFDLVKGLGDNNSYGGGTEGYNQSRVDRMIRLHNVIKSVKPNGIHINENLAGAQEERALGNDGQLQWANVNNASCQFTMGYGSGDTNLYRFLSTSDSRPWGSTVSYAESHDEERMAYRNAVYGVEGVKLPEGSNEEITLVSLKRLGCLAAQMLLVPGPKMIWQFGELGNGQTTKNGSNNDTGNKKVCWSYLDDPDRKDLHDTYATLINLRMANPELFSSNATFRPTNLSGSLSNTRTIRLTAGNKEVIMLMNPAVSGANVTVSAEATLLSPTNSQLIYATPGFAPILANAGNGSVSASIPANSFAVFATTSVSGTDDVVIEPATVNVYGTNGRIVIAGEYNNAEVYNLSGCRMNSLEVPAGIYIVNVDGQASKVIVR